MHVVVTCCHGVIRKPISRKYLTLLTFSSRYFQDLKEPKIFILTGGRTSPKSEESEAESAYAWLKKVGKLPKGEIILENFALDSFENLKKSTTIVPNYDRSTAISYLWKKERFDIMAGSLHLKNFSFLSPPANPIKEDLTREKELLLELKVDPLCEGEYFRKIREAHDFNNSENFSILT